MHDTTDSRQSGASLVPRLSPQKQGEGESLVTFARKADDFQFVIIHVINIGCSQFSNILSCDLVSCHAIRQQRKLFTTSLLVFEASAVVLSFVTHFVHAKSELQSMVSKFVLQTNYSKL